MNHDIKVGYRYQILVNYTTTNPSRSLHSLNIGLVVNVIITILFFVKVFTTFVVKVEKFTDNSKNKN